MRKALIGLLLAATAVTPIAANAAPNDGDRGGRDRGGWQRQGGESRESRRAEPAAQAQPAATPQARAEGRVRSGQVEARGRRGAGVQAAAPAPQQPVAVAQGRDPRRGGGRVAAAAEPYRQQRDAALAAGDQRTAAAAEHYGRLAAQNEARYGRGQNDRDGRNGRDDRPDWRNNNGRNDNRDWRGNNNRGNDNRDWRNGRNGRNDWNRGWRNDNRYDWQRYRYSNRNIFRPGPYYSPYRNYSYNRFSIGLILNSGFYSSRYWITDPWQYRLPPAPAGTRWVRYFDDVLLVDTYTGEVVDAIYDFFW